MQARCRESGGAHGLKTIGVVPVKKPRRYFGADSMQFLLHARRTRRQSKCCLLKATCASGGKLTIVHRGFGSGGARQDNLALR